MISDQTRVVTIQTYLITKIRLVLIGSDDIDTTEVNITQTATFICPIANPVGMKITWSKDDIPIVSETENIQVS